MLNYNDDVSKKVLVHVAAHFNLSICLQSYIRFKTGFNFFFSPDKNFEKLIGLSKLNSVNKYWTIYSKNLIFYARCNVEDARMSFVGHYYSGLFDTF